MAQDKPVSDAAARSVQGASGGLCETNVGTSAVTTFTVTAWVGRYIKINPCGGDIWYLFSTDATAASAFDETDEATTAASAAGTIPDQTCNGAPEHEVVPALGAEVYLHVKKVSDAGAVRVRPS